MHSITVGNQTLTFRFNAINPKKKKIYRLRCKVLLIDKIFV